MADYIDRERVIENFCSRCAFDRQKCIMDCIDIRQIKKAIPSADVRENVHGEWLEENICSVCGDYNEFRTNYCPNCGADMRGTDNNG